MNTYSSSLTSISTPTIFAILDELLQYQQAQGSFFLYIAQQVISKHLLNASPDNVDFLMRMFSQIGQMREVYPGRLQLTSSLVYNHYSFLQSCYQYLDYLYQRRQLSNHFEGLRRDAFNHLNSSFSLSSPMSQPGQPPYLNSIPVSPTYNLSLTHSKSLTTLDSSSSSSPTTESSPSKFSPLSCHSSFLNNTDVVHFLADVRRKGLDLIFPSINQDKIMMIVFTMLKYCEHVYFKDIVQMILDMLECGYCSELKSLSKTKIRGILTMMKLCHIINVEVISEDSKLLRLSHDVHTHYDIRMKLDNFILSLINQLEIHLPTGFLSDLLWKDLSFDQKKLIILQLNEEAALVTEYLSQHYNPSSQKSSPTHYVSYAPIPPAPTPSMMSPLAHHPNYSLFMNRSSQPSNMGYVNNSTMPTSGYVISPPASSPSAGSVYSARVVSFPSNTRVMPSRMVSHSTPAGNYSQYQTMEASHPASTPSYVIPSVMVHHHQNASSVSQYPPAPTLMDPVPSSRMLHNSHSRGSHDNHSSINHRFLARFRRLGLDLLSPQPLHDQLLACTYALMMLNENGKYPYYYKELCEMLIRVQASGVIKEMKDISKTKIYSVLKLLKQSEILTVIEYQPHKHLNKPEDSLSPEVPETPLMLSNPDINAPPAPTNKKSFILSLEIDSFEALRRKHDLFLCKCIDDFKIGINFLQKKEIIWVKTEKEKRHYLDQLHETILLATEYAQENPPTFEESNGPSTDEEVLASSSSQ